MSVEKIKRGAIGTYRTDVGTVISGIVRSIHRDDTITVEARFEIVKGQRNGCYIGHRYRMPVSRFAIPKVPQ
ncbi:MAG TPA: hypothetical protein VGU72_04455 [Beijerinckiaceae bacterium]|jgi:hypothetical protein|nr:hypothetical protein [Beijerinckiaceae bacterium]